MAVYIGSTKIGSLSLGGIGIREAYVGSTCVYKTKENVTYTYSTPTVNISYDSPCGPSSSYAIPTYSYSQTRTGSDGSTTTITSGGTLLFTAQRVTISGVTVDSSTGRLDYPINDTGSERSLCYVTLEVTLNGETGIGSCEVRQEEIILPEIYFADLDQTHNQELTDSSLISLQEYTHMQHESGTAMTIGVSLPSGASGIYTYNIAIWFDVLWSEGNVGNDTLPQYLCNYHKMQMDNVDLSGSDSGTLKSIDYSDSSDVHYGEGYYRLEFSDASLATASSSDGGTLLELDLWHFYTDLIGGSADNYVQANRYLKLRYKGTSVPTTIDEFISNIVVELIQQ